ncbi:MAG TPA: hypothetical protein VF723_16890 [Pyrinomonadaceae bacterium]|jgi:hypothetical protein
MRIKIVLLVALFVALNSIGFAQGKTKKTAVTPRFTGAPEKQKAAFKSFIIKNIGRRVYLKLTFSEEEPHAYRSQFADPVFSVDRFAYSFECGDRESETEWTARCKKLNWDASSRTISGYFKVSEPDPKVMRTNRSFYLTPTK